MPVKVLVNQNLPAKSEVIMVADNIFKVGDNVVYPSHGVGKILDVESQAIGGIEMQLYVIHFEKEKMSLRIPVNKAKKSGLRALSNYGEIEKVLQVLRSHPKTSKGMWSRRASEYETKINSGELSLIAEVVRDLYKNVDDPDRSYSERLIYESALNRLSSEFAALNNIERDIAITQIVDIIREKQAA
jgi:CarD family transcriptional regulator